MRPEHADDVHWGRSLGGETRIIPDQGNLAGALTASLVLWRDLGVSSVTEGNVPFPQGKVGLGRFQDGVMSGLGRYYLCRVGDYLVNIRMWRGRRTEGKITRWSCV